MPVFCGNLFEFFIKHFYDSYRSCADWYQDELMTGNRMSMKKFAYCNPNDGSSYDTMACACESIDIDHDTSVVFSCMNGTISGLVSDIFRDFRQIYYIFRSV